ncbi:MAG: ThiF family adenylyltransferase [Candidatus Magasanikbacteria bacterium]|nr:ThiF family adenylyltransferase [Candidatus Magasanikbacteria bacterium]
MEPQLITKVGASLEELRQQFPAAEIIDRYQEQLEELFLIRHPQYRFNKNYQSDWATFLAAHQGGRPLSALGSWFYFPWSRQLVHYLPHELHQELRTARNRNLITVAEQERFYNFTVGIAGLSVGSHPAATLAMMGGARAMKLADADTLSASNLNRVRYDYTQLGVAKCELAARYIYQLNPYASLRLYQAGITVDNITEFLAGDPRLDVLIEEMDNLEMKIRIRLAARELGIPVIMATDNGDGIIVDIERYDLDRHLPLFNGAAGDLTLEEFQNFPPERLPELAAKIVGPELIVPRMRASLGEVGKTLYSWPQLGDAATLCGVAAAYLVKRLAIGEEVKSGKYEINLGSLFSSDKDYQ